MTDRITSGIVGVGGIEPVGVAIRAGVKSERGVPIEKDRFHLMEPFEGPDKRSRPSPDFGWFNALAPERRRVIPGVIAHGSWEDALEQGYLCYRPHDHARQTMPPGRQPWCSGDGVKARRYVGQKGPDDWREMACPGEDCVYRQGKGAPASCKPASRFLFRLDWSPEVVEKYRAPTCLARFASGGWRTYRAILGLKQSLDHAAEAMGLATYSPLGYRFRLTLTEGTGNGNRYPYVLAAAIDSPVDFLVRSMDFQRSVAERVRAASVRSLAIDEDVRALTGPGGEG